MEEKEPLGMPEGQGENAPLEMSDGKLGQGGQPAPAQDIQSAGDSVAPTPTKGRRALSLILIALCFVLFAWGLKFVYQFVTDRTENKGVKGTIVTMDLTEDGGSMLIENTQPEGDEITKAFVSFTKEVKVTGPEDRAYSLEDLKVGTRVTVVITGDVLESYPVQVKAKRIIIE